jgi:DNA-binding GntR family transcriptional regulator
VSSGSAGHPFARRFSEAEHFAIRQMRRGVVGRTISEEQVLEVFTVWAALDQVAARIAAEQATLPERAQRWIDQRADRRHN